VIAEGEIRNWALFAWSVAAYTAGCGALMWWNQRRVSLTMNYFGACTRAVFTAHVLTLGGLAAVACWLGLGRGVHGAFLAAGVLAVPLTVVFGYLTDRCSGRACRLLPREYRRQLRRLRHDAGRRRPAGNRQQ
jgi:hypothetical protein